MRRPLAASPCLRCCRRCWPSSWLGCSFAEYRRAQIAEQSGELGRGGASTTCSWCRSEPGNLTYRAALLRAKIQASQAHFETGKQFAEAGRPRARADRVPAGGGARPHQPVRRGRAREGAPGARRARAPARASRRTIDEMKDEARGARASRRCSSRARKTPISLEFPKPVSIKDIYRALGKAFGINILFDPNLQGPGDRHRAQGRHRAGRARDPDARGAALLQGDRRAHHPDRRRHAAEPARLRGPGDPDLLPVATPRSRT